MPPRLTPGPARRAAASVLQKSNRGITTGVAIAFRVELYARQRPTAAELHGARLEPQSRGLLRPTARERQTHQEQRDAQQNDRRAGQKLEAFGQPDASH